MLNPAGRDIEELARLLACSLSLSLSLPCSTLLFSFYKVLLGLRREFPVQHHEPQPGDSGLMGNRQTCTGSKTMFTRVAAMVWARLQHRLNWTVSCRSTITLISCLCVTLTDWRSRLAWGKPDWAVSCSLLLRFCAGQQIGRSAWVPNKQVGCTMYLYWLYWMFC